MSMEAYVKARAKFCVRKAELQKCMSEVKRFYDRVSTEPSRVTFSDRPEKTRQYYAVDPAHWPDRQFLLELVEQFKTAYKDMNTAYDGLEPDEKAAMVRPESPALAL